MNIVHINLTGAFTEDMSYQDNLLSAQNALDGHNVSFITTCMKYNNGKRIQTEKEDCILDNGMRLIRLEYTNVFGPLFSQKVRRVNELYSLLENLKPDILMFHGLSSWELFTCARYKKFHSKVKLYADSHADANNSATNFLSRFLLHQIFYKSIIKKSINYIDKILYLSYECGDFLRELYNLPQNKLEFYPLGGIIYPEEILLAKRERMRQSLQFNKDHLMFVHSGKMDKLKRSADVLRAFSQVESNRIRLVLIGSMTEDVREEVEPLIKVDPRVSFVGWKNADELMEYLCAADVYVQPGGQSATMQTAICCGCAVMLYPHKSHEPYLQRNGYYIKSIEDMRKVFQEIADSPSILKGMSENSMKIANELLDYKKLAARLYK